MAKKISNLAEVKVYINGKEQAKRDLEELTAKAEEYKKMIEASRSRVVSLGEETEKNPEKVVAYDEERKSLNKLEKEYKKYQRLIRETKKFTEDIEEDLNNLSGQSLARLKTIERSLTAIRQKLDPNEDKDGDFLAFLNESLKRVGEAIKNRKGDLIEFKDIVDDLANIDDTSLSKVEQRIKSLIAATDKDDVDRLKQLNEELSQIQDERNARINVSAQDIITKYDSGAWDETIGKTNESIRQLKEYRDTLKVTGDAPALLEVDRVIDGLTQKIKQAEQGFMSFDEAMGKAADIQNFNGTQEELDKIQKIIREGMASKLNLSDPADLDRLKEAQLMLDNIAKKRKEIELINANQKVENVKGNISGSTPAELQEAINMAKELQKVAKTQDEFKELSMFIEQATAKLNEWTEAGKKASMQNQIKDLSSIRSLSKDALNEQLKFWKGAMDGAKATSGAYAEAKRNFEELQKESKRRLEFDAQRTISDVNLGIGDGSIKQMKERLELLQEYRDVIDGTKPDAYKEVDAAIAKLTQDVKISEAGFMSFEEAMRKAADLEHFSGTQEELEKIQKIIKEGISKELNISDPDDIDTLKEATALLDNISAKRKELAEINKRENAESKVQSVRSNIDGSSPAEIEEAIRLAKELQSMNGTTSGQYKDLARFISEAEAKLKSWNDEVKQTAMIKQMVDVTQLSKIALEEQKKYWQSMVDGAKAGDTALNTYKNNLKTITDEEKRRTQSIARGTISEYNTGSWDKTIGETREALKQLKEYRDTLKTTGDAPALLEVDRIIDGLTQKIKQAEQGFMSFDEAMMKAADIQNFNGTLETLDQIQKIIKEGMASKLLLSDPADVDRLKEAQKFLEDISKKKIEIDRLRTGDQATQYISDATSGSWDKTIEETQQAIKLIEEYKKQLRVESDAPAIQSATDAINILNQKIGKTKEGLMGIDEAKKIAGDIVKGKFDGTAEDIERAKKALEEYRKTLRQKTDATEIKIVDEALKDLGHSAEQAARRIINIDELLKNLDAASVEDLQAAAKQLQEELQNATRGTEEYAKTAAKLREVNKELKRAKKEWEGQENVIAKTAKRLMAYVAVYGGFNEILGKMKEMVQLNLQLSDSMADVQKTTGLTGIELQELGRELERIDTRTATTELYQLAAAAGQIGLKTQEDVLGFAKAANTISVALNELGAEGSATIAKIATLTGDVARSGTEQALLKVGSAINELTANSAATAGPIADFISRVGGIASASNIAIHEMAALGAATDASAQSIEIAGTSMNKFITALVSNTENIAYATNLNAQELQNLINEGNTMQAIVRVLESMQTMDRGGISAAMKELGSEGARMNQFVASMVSNLDMLKAQLAISKEAFEENVSVINEYNVKQESAMGILQRMKNAFMDTFVNSKMTEVLKDILETIASIPSWLEKNRTVLLAIRIVIAQLLLFKLPFLISSLMKQLWGLYALLSGPMLTGIKAFRHAWRQAELELVFSGKAVNALTISLRTLGNVIKAHPVMFLASVVTAGLVAWYHFREETDEVVKATAELSQKHSRQIEELQALRNALEATNTSYAVKAAAMREINSLYSKYLGFELSELDNYEKKKAALDYINAKLKENQTIELANRQNEVYTKKFNEDAKDDIEGLTEGLMGNSKIGAKRLTEAMNVINESIKNGAENTREVLASLEEYFNVDLSDWVTNHGAIEKNLLSDWLEDDPYEDLENYFKKYSTLQQQTAGTDEYFNEQKIENQRLSDEALEKLVVAHQNKIQAITSLHQEKLAKMEAEGTAMTEAEQIQHLQNLLKEQEQYQKSAEKMLQRAKEKDEEFIASQTNEETGMIDLGNMHARYGGTETGHIVSSRVRELNDIRAEMLKVRKEIAAEERALEEANEKLRKAQKKKDNEEEIRAAEETVEAKKKAINDGNEAIIRAEMEWTGKYAELQTWATSDARKKWNETTEEIGRNIRSLQIQIAGDPWGKAFDLKDWKQFPELIEGLEGASVTSLVQGFEKLRDNTKLITQDVDAFNKMFDLKKPLKDLDEVNTQVYRWLAQIRTELKKRGRNTSGSPIFTNAKEEMDNVLKNLQTHFLKRQAEIRRAYIDGSMTSEEMDRRLAENDRIFINERIELRKLLLGENSNFMKELYPDLADTDLMKLRLDLEVLGDEVTADLRKDMEEDENIVRESAIKIRKALEKELLSTDPFETLKQSFRSSLDELELMSSDFEREMIKSLQLSNTGELKYNPFDIMGLDEESQQERLDFLIELSRKSYTVDKDGLRMMFESHADYYNWVTHLDDTQMQVMLNKLQWFYDESLLKHKAYADRLIKSQDSRYEQEGLKLGDIGKIEWEIENLTQQKNNLVLAQSEAIVNAAGDAKAVKDAEKLYEEEITAHTQAINRLEEKLLEEQEKAANKNKSFRSKKEREAKEQMEASISALEAFYKEQEAVIRQNAFKYNWTPEDLERKLTENKIKAETDGMELRKRLLGDPSEFDPFANDSYKGAITGTVFFGNTRNLDKQAEQIKVWGKGFRDGMRNEIAQSSVEIAKEMQKVSDTIKNALLEGDMFGKFENEFATMLDKLGILTSDFEDEVNKAISESFKSTGVDVNIGLSKEERAKRIESLTKFADQSYQINEEGLKKLMMQNTEFSSWVNNLNDEDMTVLLQKLRDYYDQRIQLTRQYQDKLNKEFESYYQQTGQQAEYEDQKQKIDKGKESREQLESYGVTRGIDYDAKRQGIVDEYQNESDVLSDKADFLKERLATLQEGSAEYIATQKLITDTELEQNQLLADSQKELTQVYMDEWTKRAERWGQWGEMFGEYLGEQVMLEKQANAARARGDYETAKKIEQQQKQNKNALIQNLLNKIVDEAALWAKEYALKMMFNSLMMAEDKRRAIEEVSLEGRKSTLSILLNALTGQSKEHSKGIPGLITGAIIFAATMALQAFAKSAIANMFPEAASSTTNRKLSTGMLTYAEGNYPVLGNDGKVYDAKYEGAGMKTGIYGGGAHFGIFSEKQPEMIVDGKTTQKLILNYPYIYDAITTIAKNGRLVNAMPTFASGDYPAGMQRIAQVETVDVSGANQQIMDMQEELAQSREVNRRLLKVLEGGLVAHVDGLENYKQQKKNERFLKRRGID